MLIHSSDNLVMETTIIATLEILFDEGADINAYLAANGMTPLHIAVCRGYRKVVSFLLNYKEKVDIDAVNNYGKTALCYACENDNPHILFELLKHGATKNLDRAREALAFVKEDSFDFFQFLLSQTYS